MASNQNGRPARLKPKNWLTVRKMIQAVSFVIFILLFLWSNRLYYLDPDLAAGAAGLLVNLPLRLDPLVMLTQLLSSRVFLWTSLFSLLTITLTIIFGRVWCGWVCPLGTLLDWIPIRKEHTKGSPPAQGWRSVKFLFLLVILFAAALGNLTLLILDPITIMIRSLTTFALPALDTIVTTLERSLFRIPLLQPGIGRVDSWIRPLLLPLQPDSFRSGMLFGMILIGIIALNAVASRFWCRYLCPLGGLLGVLAKFSWFRARIQGDCTICGQCVQVCPTGAIRDEGSLEVDTSECTMCMVCPTSCPTAGIQIRPGAITPSWNTYDPDRRKVLLSLGAAAAGVSIFQRDFSAGQTHPHLIRPPGVLDADLLQKCIRCGECGEVCPTNAIQPAIAESGLEGVWTPILIPRTGYCDYSCNACGWVCPVEAIPPLIISEKRLQVIGKAYINTNRCIPWTDLEDCIVCEEMCPIPDKAILLNEETVQRPTGEVVTVLRPFVVRERCIGCGICENKCPVAGEAAIRVYSPPRDCQTVLSA